MILRRLTSAIALSALLAPPALACAFHSYIPEPTLVDRLLMSEDVALIEQTGVTRLRGVAPPEALPILLGEDALDRLSATPDAALLMVREDIYGPWDEAAVVDVALRLVLDKVMAKLPEWEWGDGTERATYFASLLDHPDNDVRALALQELDIVTYDRLQKAVAQQSADILAQAASVGDTSNPIRILLAGLSRDPSFVPGLRRGVTDTIGTQSPTLGAYATALLELEGPAAATWISNNYLADPMLDETSRELLVQALSLHSTSGSSETKAALRAGLGDAMQSAPPVAAVAARQFGLRWDWSLSPALAKMLTSKKVQSMSDILMVAQYVNLAQQEPQSSDSQDP